MRSWVAFTGLAVVLVVLAFSIYYIDPDLISTRALPGSGTEVAEEVADEVTDEDMVSTPAETLQAQCESTDEEKGLLTFDTESKNYRCQFDDFKYCIIPASGKAAEASCSYPPGEQPGWVKDISPDTLRSL